MPRAIFTAFLCLCATLAQGQATYQPQIGQAGKDVVWVPTPDRLIERMLQMADTTAKDVVVDLGSGDGRIPITAAKKFGARALGIEYEADLVRLSIRSAERQGVADRVRFLRQDLFQTDLSEATVVTLYVSPTSCCSFVRGCSLRARHAASFRTKSHWATGRCGRGEWRSGSESHRGLPLFLLSSSLLSSLLQFSRPS